MAVRVQCACGKSFQAVEALIGKNVRCPACSTMVPVPASASPAAAAVTAPDKPKSAARGTKFDPAAAAARKQVKAVPTFSLSPKAVIFCCTLVGLSLLVILAKVGPVRAMDQWKELEPLLDDYTHDIVNKVCREQYKDVAFDQFVPPPKVTSIMIDGPIMMFTLPKEIFVQGRSTEGHFKGIYFTREKRFEIDIGVDGDYRTLKVKSHVDDNGHPVIDEQK